MGIYGALSNAVSGLRAQAFALENISGNIANSQTAGFKRIDTDFLDMIPDAPQSRQTAGSVLAQSRSTNSVQGDVKSVATETNMAINGNGFFVVEPSIGQVDGSAVFAGADYYTRRGDFDLDKSGYLVNGAGYYLKGLPIDPVTQNISGSVPEPLRVSNTFMPASPTSRVTYQLNLPLFPKTAAYQESQTVGDELLRTDSFVNAPALEPAMMRGRATVDGGALASSVMPVGETLTLAVGGTSTTFTFVNGPTANPDEIDVTATLSAALAELQTKFQATAGAGTATVGLNAANQVEIDLNDAGANSLTVTASDTGLGFPTSAVTADPRATTVSAADSAAFVDQSVAGGAITAYSESGASANVQMRWAKVSSAASDGADVWNLFVMTNGAAEDAETMWTRYGGDFVFDSSGRPTPAIRQTVLEDLEVNGVTLGTVTLNHGANGLTQFADSNGTAEVTALNQNGYAAGEFVSVAVNNNGRVVVSYNNGQQLEVAQVVTANFNAANQLKRMDGGVFAATSESGEPILDNDGGIIGASLEASNTDISEEFTKLIITQQAYAAGTRIVSSADEMLQEALNMVR
ncbi:MAG TPA: flagellar hook-basal body complex protein [Devosiaceae bacterium]|jgi:flagellar hook protein FlgE|nr:flagellar hook-basal body complex protein [Devosiaceae bacterium]